jgi:hypothetical protein
MDKTYKFLHKATEQLNEFPKNLLWGHGHKVLYAVCFGITEGETF